MFWPILKVGIAVLNWFINIILEISEMIWVDEGAIVDWVFGEIRVAL